MPGQKACFSKFQCTEVTHISYMFSDQSVIKLGIKKQTRKGTVKKKTKAIHLEMKKQTAKHSSSLDWNQWGVTQGCGKLRLCFEQGTQRLVCSWSQKQQTEDGMVLWLPARMPQHAPSLHQVQASASPAPARSPPRWQTPSCWGDDKFTLSRCSRHSGPGPSPAKPTNVTRLHEKLWLTPGVGSSPSSSNLAPCQGHDIQPHRW